MFLFEMLLALILALVVFAILAPAKRYRSPDGGAVWIFFIPLLFLLIWAGGVWMTPVGPMMGGVHWVPFLVPAIILLLLLFAVSTPSQPSSRDDDVTPRNAEEEAAAGTIIAFSIFFWVLIAMAAVALIARYM